MEDYAMFMTANTNLTQLVAESVHKVAHPLTGAANDYDALLALIGDARFVLIGEASHGTHEFYRERAQITQRLINEKGFNAVAVEADWPDADRVNRYVRDLSENGGSRAALAGFQRFPQWMWRNADVLDFVDWLRAHNDQVLQDGGAGRPSAQVGFYGLDLFWLQLRPDGEAVAGLPAPRRERAIGVVYRPESERLSHYFWARLPQQFDALLFFDKTQAVEPLERNPEWEQAEVPETFPTGI
jgi:erythromycin esterase-like protein